MQRTWIALGALAGLTAVAMAALAAHGLDQTALALAHSAIELQAWHAPALLACGLWAPRGGRLADCAGAAFAIGIVLFCGAIYALALGGVRVPMMPPVGGTLLMLGWLLLGLSAVLVPRDHAARR